MEEFIFDLSVIIVISAALSVVAFFLKQPIIIAYIACGMLIGPWGIGLVKQPESVRIIADMGITLLLFLAGLCLHPKRLLTLFRKISLVTFANCVVSFGIVFLIAAVFRFSLYDSIIAGLALMFSSTILLVKLMPTTELHHERMGAVCIAILILEDLIAVLLLAVIRSVGLGHGIVDVMLLIVKLFAFVAAIFLIEQFILRRLMKCVDRFHETLFILGLAWCFGIAAVSNKMGLFYATGAFFAGVALARQTASLFISEKLKPLRDFFLVLFFFSLGAEFNLLIAKDVLVPSLILAAILLLAKPLVFRLLFQILGEKSSFATEAGVRLGQLSEFSLLIALLAYDVGRITIEVSQMIQLVTIITLIVSSYVVVFRYPTPIGTRARLMRD
jgi:glutathione-regulated potassium-efflux system ancillary protein KefC